MPDSSPTDVLRGHSPGDPDCPECYRTYRCHCGGVAHAYEMDDSGGESMVPYWIERIRCDRCGQDYRRHEGQDFELVQLS